MKLYLVFLVIHFVETQKQIGRFFFGGTIKEIIYLCHFHHDHPNIKIQQLVRLILNF
jgi:hypothetical protein